jgi:hypothetical protein
LSEKTSPSKSLITRTAVDGDYVLSDFGNPNYKDRIDSVTVLSILVAFTIPLFVEGFKRYPDLDIAASYFLGATVLIFFMFYTVDYYEKIWSRWFSLPEDFGFFRIYSLVTGVIVIAAMTVHPEYWYIYISVLFLILSIKKYSTRKKYERAFRKEYPTNDDCDDDQKLCVFLLVQNMSRNFLILGFYASVPIAVALAFLLSAKIWPFKYSVFGRDISGDFLFLGLSIFYAGRLITFWYKKVRVLLKFMVEEVEKGNVRYYATENRKLL